MPTEPIRVSDYGLDLSRRVTASVTVAGSPALAAETIICQIPALDAGLAIVTGVILSGFAAFTVGTSGTAVRLRIRRTDVAGAVKADTGATTGGIAAAALVDMNVGGLDLAPPAGTVYVLTLQVTAGAAVSTVSAAQLVALAI